MALHRASHSNGNGAGSRGFKSLVVLAVLGFLIFLISELTSGRRRSASPERPQSEAPHAPLVDETRAATPEPTASTEPPQQQQHHAVPPTVAKVLASYTDAKNYLKLARRKDAHEEDKGDGPNYVYSESLAVEMIQQSCTLHKLTYEPKVFTQEHMYPSMSFRAEAGAGATESLQYVSMRKYRVTKPLPTEGTNGPVGTVLFYHGCGHSAKDFCFIPEGGNDGGAAEAQGGKDNTGGDGVRGPAAGFQGLPEEMRWAVEVVRRGWDYLALSSRDKHSKCWGSHKFIKDEQVNNVDLLNTLAMIHHEEEILSSKFPTQMVAIQKANPRKEFWSKMRTKPFIAMGASSGGAFVAKLPRVIGTRLQVVIPQVMAPPPQIKAVHQVAHFYSVMEKDKASVAASKIQCNTLKRSVKNAANDAGEQGKEEEPGERNSRMSEIPCKVYVAKALAISMPNFFSKRVLPRHWISDELSGKIVAALDEGDFLDASSKHLAQDPRRSDWRKVVKPLLSGSNVNKDTLKADHSILAEEMNTAFCKHEFTADEAVEIMQEATLWLERQLRKKKN